MSEISKRIIPPCLLYIPAITRHLEELGFEPIQTHMAQNLLLMTWTCGSYKRTERDGVV